MMHFDYKVVANAPDLYSQNQKRKNMTQTDGSDSGNVGLLGILFFCIPLAGAIMYFVWKDEKPMKAKKACSLALWGFGFGIVLNIIVSLLGAL